MKLNRRAKFALTFLAAQSCNTAYSQEAVVVAVPAQAGPVNGTSQNSDAFIWQVFTEFTVPALNNKSKPVVFETWASDEDVFSNNPHWPSVDEPKKLHVSPLSKLTGSPHVPSGANALIDATCGTPGNAAVGGFPANGCIAEETKRNRPQYDYIVNNQLNNQAGLAKAFANSFAVTMPTSAVSVKGDWVPVKYLLEWIPSLGCIDNIEKQYYTAVSGGVEYALVSLHVSSRQNPNWVWGTFEHQKNPGRCDDMGCFDSIGAEAPVVPPNRAAINTQYGNCAKTPALKAMMAKANLLPVWENYCLKSTQVDYVASNGTPYILGNSVIERIVGNGTVAASSCISCHYYASFDAKGKPANTATAMLPYNPSGNPIPAVLNKSSQFDFMWGVLLAPAAQQK